MTYRDDHDAALARAEALEAELAEAREKIERLERAQQAPKPAPPPDPPKQPARPRRQRAARKPWILGALGAVGTVGLVVAAILGARACTRNRVLRGAGELYAAHVMQAKDGSPRLVVVSEVINLADDSDVTPWRIDLLDPATGHRLRRQVFWNGGRGHRPELLPATPGRMWCDLDGSYVGKRNLIELCDVDTLQVAVSIRELLAKQPTLAGGFASSPDIDPVSGALFATTTSGEAIRLTPDLTLSVAAADTAPNRVGLGRDQDGSTMSAADAGRYTFDRVEGGTRQGLFLELGYDYGAPKRRIGDETFLDPELLSAYGHDGAAIVAPEDTSVILIHRDTTDYNTAHLLIDGFGMRDGKTRWTVTEPAGEVKMGARIGDVAIIALRLFDDRQSLVLGLDWHDGHEVWRYAM